MSQGVPGAGRDYGRRRRWLSQLPEDFTPPTQVERTPHSPANMSDSVEERPPTPEASTSSILPRRTWVLALMIAVAMLSWAGVVGVGVYLDLNHVEPWRGILGIQAGSLLRFYTTVSLLACAQLSYLILWRRSRSRKDFAGRYRVWFWIGAVCSVFCVASATRFHESWATRMTTGLHLAWVDLETLSWMVPATTMLMAAIYLLGRDLPSRSASNVWIQSGRWLSVIAGLSLLVGSLLVPAQWLGPVQAALGALWPTVLGCGLLIYARYVTYVTNEVHRERKAVRRSRWISRLSDFAGQVSEMAREEWQLYLQRRDRAKTRPVPTTKADQTQTPEIAPRSRTESSETRERVTSPLQKMLQQPITAKTNDEEDLESEVPETRAVNVRPLQRANQPAGETSTLHAPQPSLWPARWP